MDGNGDGDWEWERDWYQEKLDNVSAILDQSLGGDDISTLQRERRCLELILEELGPRETSTAAPSVVAAADGRCPTSWDTVLCWPPSPAGAVAVLPCPDDIGGIKYDVTQNATRWCHSNVTWGDYVNYSNCHALRPSPVDDPTTIMTLFFAGYCLSLAALAVAVWIFLYFKDLRCLRNLIHTNLMCTYIFYDAMWILNASLQVLIHDKVSCVFLMGLLHYFYLTNFFWMFVEGLYLFMLVVATFTGENIKSRVYLFIGWGIPVIIILLWGFFKSFGQAAPGGQVNPDDPLMLHCPSMADNVYDWIHKAPACAVLVMNFVFLVMIMWVLITKLRSANTVETQQYRKATKALLVLIPLLGLTYILTIRGPPAGVSLTIYMYTRTIMISLQGFMVALFYCFLNTEVQNTVRHHVERWRTARSVGGGRRYTYSGHSKDWSPRSRTESIRLGDLPYGGSLCGAPAAAYRKRESTASETTTTTLLGPPGGTVGNGGALAAGRLSNGSGAGDPRATSAVRAAACPFLLGEENAV